MQSSLTLLGETKLPLDRSNESTLTPTLIFLAVQGHGREARAALSTLYETYQRPVRDYIRRWSHRRPYDADKVDDLMQEFFLLRIEKRDLVKNWNPGRSRFRTWLFGALNHFLLNKLDEHRKESLRTSLDEARHEPWHLSTPEHLVGQERARDRARILVDRALVVLRSEYERRRQLELHDALVPYLAQGRSRSEQPPYFKLSRALGKSLGTLRADVFRMRGRWRRVLREEIGRTVPDSAIENEVRLLLAALEDRSSS